MPLPLTFGTDLLTAADCYAADSHAVSAGIPSLTLMENACAAVARAVRRRWSPRPTVVLCGPGNNGGDGFGAAVLLRAAGWPVTVALLGDRAKLSGDAAEMAARWPGPVGELAPAQLDGQALVIDALFGAGLARPLAGPARDLIETLADRGTDMLAIDVPSGIDGDTGAVLGAAAPARATVTFFRPKPGHYLLPARTLIGELIVVDIGMPADTVANIGPTTRLNGPDLWLSKFHWPNPDSHKYQRGHALIVGGPVGATGAARLAAEAALVIGAGLVTVACPTDALPVYGAQLTSVMTRSADAPAAFADLLADVRKNAVLIGPGAGVNAVTRERVLAILDTRKPCVLDADALTVFADAPDNLIAALHDQCVLTPHDGEYVRLFDHSGDRLARARRAAAESGAVVLLKGGDTAIAAPDGAAVVNPNAPPTLATAGAGDVLAGMICGLMAQGLAAFDAACAAAWMHGDAARRLGGGLISERLAAILPEVITDLARRSNP